MATASGASPVLGRRCDGVPVSAHPGRSRAASFVRRMSETLARADSSDAVPHHQAYLEQLRVDDPPSDVRLELRSLWEHVRFATGAPQATPWSIALSAVMVCLGLLMVPVLPEPSFPYVDPPMSLLAQALHFVGFLGIAVAVFSPPALARRRFLRWGVLPNMGAQVLYLVTTLPEDDPLVAFADGVLKFGEAVGLLACLGVIVGCRGHRRIFRTGWYAVGASMVVLGGSQTLYAVAFARHGESMWVVSLLLTGAAVWVFAYGLVRYVPAWWQHEPVGSG
jgi:hypothetical protein